MQLPNCEINITGFQLSEKKRSAISLIIQTLQNRSPSDSALSLSIVCGENDVNGFLSIVSRSTRFESHQCGIDPVSVVKLLNKDLLGQLRKWVSQRKF